MKLVADNTRRFAQRPHYEPSELDSECEELVSRFLRERLGRVEFPISTSDLTVLIEREVGDLDSAADLGDLGDDVEGVTDFYRGRKPRVRIASHLWEGRSRENRLRTTLTHELGHVRFHNYLYQVEASLELFTSTLQGTPLRCKRQDVHGSSKRDWMEWQAGYASGAFLMPRSGVREVARRNAGGRPLAAPPIGAATSEGMDLIARIAGSFQVSEEAAFVRLSQLGYLVSDPHASPTLALP